MGAGVAFPDSTYAPSGFFSWKSANAKVDVGPSAARTITNISTPVASAAGAITLTSDSGQLILQNLPNDITQAGPLDSLLSWSFDMRRANLYWIGDGTWANRQLVDSALLQQPFATLVANGTVNSTLVFQLRDPRVALAMPLQPVKYLGNNANGLGVEGESDIRGAPKPVLYGVASNISPVRVNAALLIYQVADRPAAILCVRDGGLALAAGTIRASLASLQSTSPPSGGYDIYSGPEGCFFRLGTTPVFQITCDAQEGQGRANLLQQSRAADQAAWVKTNVTITANSSAAPDGTTTADTATRTSAGASYVGQGVTLPGVGATYVYWGEFHISVGNFVGLAANAGTARADACFNLNTGAVSIPASVTGDFPAAQAGIIPKAGGFYRCWLAFTTAADATVSCYYSPSTVSQVVDGAGSSSSAAVIVADQMLEAGFNPTRDIVSTTTSPVTAQRANLLTAPSDLTNAAWTKAGATATADTIAAPDGSVTADTLTRTTTGASSASQSISKAAANLPYAYSAYADALSGSFVSMRLDDGAGNRADACFNLTAGSVSIAAAVTGTFANPSTIMRDLGNGFWRLGLLATTALGVTLKATVSSASVSQQVDGTGSANSTAAALWGQQLEQSSVVTQEVLSGSAGADMANRTHAAIWARLRTERAGTLVSSLNLASVAATDLLDGNEVGFYWNAETTQLDAMNEILTSLSGFEVEGFDFTWSVGKLVAPSGTTVLDFCLVNASSLLTAKNRGLKAMQSVRPGFAPDGAPPYRVTVNWGRAYLVMVEADFAGAAPQRLRDKFGMEYRSETRVNTAIWNPATATGPWLSAREITVNCGYQPGDDGLRATHAGAEAQRLLDLYSANKDSYQIDFTPKVTDQIQIGQVCSLAYPQFGLSGAPLFVVMQNMLKVENEIPTMTLVLGFQT